MRSKAGMKFDCIFEETLDFIDIDYTHLNKTIRYEQRPRGKWIWKSYDMKNDCGDIECSKCSCVAHEGVPAERLKGKLWDYCPVCGSDNRREQTNEM